MITNSNSAEKVFRIVSAFAIERSLDSAIGDFSPNFATVQGIPSSTVGLGILGSDFGELVGSLEAEKH